MVTTGLDAGPAHCRPIPHTQAGTVLLGRARRSRVALPQRTSSGPSPVWAEPPAITRHQWAWQIRGLIDQVLGGAGLRRGRRHPEEVRQGEPLDFWRVVDVRPNQHLTLKAEMKVPGEAWLEWDIEEHNGRLLSRPTRHLHPTRAVRASLLVHVLVPFHGFVFPQMATRDRLRR